MKHWQGGREVEAMFVLFVYYILPFIRGGCFSTGLGYDISLTLNQCTHAGTLAFDRRIGGGWSRGVTWHQRVYTFSVVLLMCVQSYVQYVQSNSVNKCIAVFETC